MLTKLDLKLLISSINIYWISKFTIFRDHDDTAEQVWAPKQVICKFRERDDITNKFKDLNGRFVSLGTGITQPNKFEDR